MVNPWLRMLQDPTFRAAFGGESSATGHQALEPSLSATARATDGTPTLDAPRSGPLAHHARR